MTKAAELREMSDEQLGLMLKEAAESVFRLRVKSQTEKAPNASEMKHSRRLIARIKTIQTQRARRATAPGAR